MAIKEHRLRRYPGIFAGVCAGLGEFFGISAFWFRLLFLILALPGGAPGILAYLIMWFIMPRR